MTHANWPELRYDTWKDTYETLHMWMQIVGKVRLARMPWLNHCWQVTFYATARGLTTARMPYGKEHFQIDFDFIAHELGVQTSTGERRSVALVPMTVADFYRAVMAALTDVGMPVRIYPRPCEVESQVPFDLDVGHRAYDAEYAHRCWQILCSATDVLSRFRSRFIGMASPVHFFWGAFDLAV